MPTFRVMIVTEDPKLRGLLTALLSEPRFEPFPAADSFDALRQIYYVAPQVIIADTELIAYAGFELMPFLRRRFPDVAVIALVREHWKKADHSDDVFADEYVRVDPLTMDHLASALARSTARCCPQADDLALQFAKRSAKPESPAKVPAKVQTIRVTSCTRCAELQQNAQRARMQALLADGWRRLHAADSDAVRQSSDADAMMKQAMYHLRLHRRQAHRGPAARSDSQAQAPACDALARPSRFATG